MGERLGIQITDEMARISELTEEWESDPLDSLFSPPDFEPEEEEENDE